MFMFLCLVQRVIRKKKKNKHLDNKHACDFLIYNILYPTTMMLIKISSESYV